MGIEQESRESREGMTEGLVLRTIKNDHISGRFCCVSFLLSRALRFSGSLVQSNSVGPSIYSHYSCSKVISKLLFVLDVPELAAAGADSADAIFEGLDNVFFGIKQAAAQNRQACFLF